MGACSRNLWSAIFTIHANPLKCHCHARNLKTVISLNHVLQYCIPLYFRTLRSWLTLPCAISLFYMHITIKKCILFWAFGAPALYSHILACSERRPHPSQKFSLLPTMISVRPPPPIPPTPTGAPTLTASATASSTSTRATIATWRSRGRSIRMCR